MLSAFPPHAWPGWQDATTGEGAAAAEVPEVSEVHHQPLLPYTPSFKPLTAPVTVHRDVPISHRAALVMVISARAGGAAPGAVATGHEATTCCGSWLWAQPDFVDGPVPPPLPPLTKGGGFTARMRAMRVRGDG